MTAPPTAPEPPRDCPRCPRLVAYREANALRHPDWFNGAVPSFGDASGRLLVLGLAPGVAGANRTGRPFTGDYAGELLYATLTRFGLANGRFAARPDDGLALTDCLVSNAVRCVPPAEQAHPRRDRHLPPLPRRPPRRPAPPPRRPLPRPHRPRDAHPHPRPPPRRPPLRPRRPPRPRPPRRLRQLPLLALQHQHRPPDAGHVRGRLRRPPRLSRQHRGARALRLGCRALAAIGLSRSAPPRAQVELAHQDAEDDERAAEQREARQPLARHAPDDAGPDAATSPTLPEPRPGPPPLHPHRPELTPYRHLRGAVQDVLRIAMAATASAGAGKATKGTNHGTQSLETSRPSVGGRLPDARSKVRPPSSSHRAMQLAVGSSIRVSRSSPGNRSAIQGKTSGKSAAESIARVLVISVVLPSATKAGRAWHRAGQAAHRS